MGERPEVELRVEKSKSRVEVEGGEESKLKKKQWAQPIPLFDLD